MNEQYKLFIAAIFSLLSLGVIAGESYSCKLDSAKMGNWLPSSIQISFNDEKQLTRLYAADYPDYELELVEITRWTKEFRELKYIAHLPVEGGGTYRTRHSITILPKLNNKIVYSLNFYEYSTHFTASGQCKKKWTTGINTFQPDF